MMSATIRISCLIDMAAITSEYALAASAAEVFAGAEMVVKVKEPQPAECALLRPGQILYTYLHLAPDAEQTKALLASGAVCIAYETITGAGGGLPLLAPMSEVAGRMAVQAGAAHLEKSKGGMGLLLGGALLAGTSCTLHVDRVILYNTEMAKPSPTPRLN